MSTYRYNDTSKLSVHFRVSEFRCRCGGNHDIIIENELVKKLEAIHAALGCSKIIVNSGYRCPSHDKAAGGSGSGQHTKGTAADVVCYDKNGKIISTKIVCCAAQDAGFSGIANIDKGYTAAHLDVRNGKWYGDETKGTSYSIPEGDFYAHFGLKKSDVCGKKELKINSLVIDGAEYSGTLTEK